MSTKILNFVASSNPATSQKKADILAGLPKCVICHTSYVSGRSMMCATCEEVALYLGRELLRGKKGTFPVEIKGPKTEGTTMYKRVDWSDRAAPWVVLFTVVYWAAQIIRAIVTHAPGFGG